jgi:hypothetical protein
MASDLEASLITLALLLTAPLWAADPVPPAVGGKPDTFKAEPLLVDDLARSTATKSVAISLLPPAPPERAKHRLSSSVDVSRDLSRTIEFLETGRAYYKAFTAGGSHTPAENKAFVAFLQDYERELGYAKQELDTLRAWYEKKSDLKAP